MTPIIKTFSHLSQNDHSYHPNLRMKAMKKTPQPTETPKTPQPLHAKRNEDGDATIPAPKGGSCKKNQNSSNAWQPNERKRQESSKQPTKKMPILPRINSVINTMASLKVIPPNMSCSVSTLPHPRRQLYPTEDRI